MTRAWDGLRNGPARWIGSAVFLAAACAWAPAAAQDMPDEGVPAEPATAEEPPAQESASEADAAVEAAAAPASAEPAPSRRATIFVAAAPNSGVSGFHLVKQGSCQRVGRWQGETAGCVKWLADTRAFGPKPVNARYRLRRVANYYLVPVCSGYLRWRFHALASTALDTDRVELRCA